MFGLFLYPEASLYAVFRTWKFKFGVYFIWIMENRLWCPSEAHIFTYDTDKHSILGQVLVD